MSTSGFPPTPPGPPQFRLPPRPSSPVTSGKAIAAFVLGFLSLLFWVVAALPAIVLALMARADVKRDPQRYSGRGLANAGVALAVVGLVLPPLMVAVLMSVTPGGAVQSFGGGPKIAHLHLSGALNETTGTQDPFAIFNTGALSLVELLRAIKTAETDEDVKALVFTVDRFAFGAAQREELVRAFKAFKDAGKPLLVHTTTLDTRTYALFAHATHLSMAPTDMVVLTGLYSEGMYLKDALDSIHAEFQIIHIGDFKSAGESFTRNEPSPEAEANTNWLLDSLYENLVNSIADARGMDASHVRSLIDGGLYSTDEARALGIIDAVQFVDEFLETVRSEVAEDAKIDDRYFTRLRQKWRKAGPAFSDLIAGQQGGRMGSKPIVGIVSLEGAILPGYGGNAPIGSEPAAYGDVLRKVLNDAAEDDDIAAVVLRVNSPGGSVTACEVILRALVKLQEKKPVVISMGNVAASGGYYVAALADAIFADASTVTGSIGVVGGKLVLGGTWEELGIHWKPYKRGENADLFSSSQPFSDAQTERLRTNMESAYARFTGHVEAGRGEKLMKPLAELTGGRVFTGQQALDYGLIDQIGGLQEAVAHAAELAHLKKYRITMLPETQDFWTLFFQDMQHTGDRPSDLQTLARSAYLEFVGGAGTPSEFALIQQLDPVKSRALLRAFTALHLIQRENVVVLAPELLSYP